MDFLEDEVRGGKCEKDAVAKQAAYILKMAKMGHEGNTIVPS
jgi:hypothetical protein